MLKLLRERTSHRDERAVGAAAALFVFLLLTKIALLAWNMLSTPHRRPLADLPPEGALYLPGADLLFCFAFAGCLFVLHQLRGRVAWLGVVLRVALWAFVVLFTVSSFQVARIFGAPLDIELLRAGDDLMVLRRSMWEYVGALPLALLACGTVLPLVLTGWFARRLARRTWLPQRWQLWAAVGVICVGMGGMQWVRLHRIDTFGVKENAIIHFVRHYEPPMQPIDVAAHITRVEAHFKDSLQRTAMPASLVVPEGKVRRDFEFQPDPAAADLNLIFIQMESTAAVHVDRQSAPNICALADNALNFKRHVTSMTQTRSATYSLNYSDYLPELSTAPSLIYNRPMPQTALFEVLRRAGYRTGLFHTGFLDYFEIRYLFKDKGVQTMMGAREIHFAGAPLAYSSAVHEEAAVDEMIRWIRAQKGAKFFASYITEFPHHPYLSFEKTPPFPQDTWVNRYRNSLHYADSAVGRLLDFLRAAGLMEKTLIVLVGDHGETVSDYPVGHGLHVSVEEMRTPFVLSNPKLFPAARESLLMTSHIDVPTTIVQLLGLNAPSEWLGRNLLAEEIPAAVHFVTMPHSRKIAAVDDNLVCVRQRGGGLELFEITGDTLTPVPQNDPRQALVPHYARETEWYEGWSYWRHLKRSQLPDVARRETEAGPPSDAEKASFSGS